MGQLAALDTKMEKVVERYDAATGKLSAIKAHMASNQRTLDVTRYNLQMAKSMLQQRVVAMYKQRPVELLDVMLSTKSFSSMVDQLDMLHRVGTSDSTMIDSIGSYQTTIVATQKALVTDRTAAEQLVAQRATEKAGVESALATRQSMLKGVKAQIAQLVAQKAQANRRPPRSRAPTCRRPSRSTPTTAAWWPLPRASSARCPTCGAAPRRPASTAPALPCTSTPTSAWACRTTPPPSSPRCAAVPAGQEQPGDLVFFGNPAYHVGIYAGGGSMIDAPHTGAIRKLRLGRRGIGVRPALTFGAAAAPAAAPGAAPQPRFA